MSDEQVIGEVEEGLLWFVTRVQALARWLWGMVPVGGQGQNE